MSTPILPFAVWESGTNQNSIPANDNSLRNQILNGNVISQAVTAQPASPADGDIYIIAATHTGAAWAGFTPKDLAIYRSGTWYAFAPVEGVVVNVAGALYKYASGAWVAVGGGLTNPMTTAEDIIKGGVSGAPARLAVGSNGNVLTVTGGVVGWAAPAGGGGGLTNWTEGVNTSAPNSTTPVVTFTVTNAASRVDAAVIPKGGGAILAQIPDNTSTGGDKRGTRGVDLQQRRGTSTQVASGQESVIPGGFNNTASAAQCFAMGDSSTASGNAATAFGMTNIASGYGSGCWGGGNNTADGQRSLTLGGQYQSTKGLTGITTFGHAGSIAVAAGKRQGELYAWSANTSSATPTVLTQDGTSSSSINQVILANNSCTVIQGQVNARQNTTGDTKGWIFSAVVKRGASAAATALVGTPTVTVVGADAGASAWTLAIAADTSNGGMALQITGEASKIISWTGSGMTAYTAA